MRNIGLKVFSATKARDRELLGETITEWIRAHRDYEILDKIVTQSSDAEFHCLAITLLCDRSRDSTFYAEQTGISASNAGVRIFRAREALRKHARACGTCAEHGCLDCTCGQPTA